jgi:AraC-like DNA-binding protein
MTAYVIKMQVQFHHIQPPLVLKTYIEKMWVFKSSGKMPVDDMKLVVPNGNIKLTVSYQNGIVADLQGKLFHSNENDITLTGLIDVPVILDADKDVATETIGIEFNPKGAYRFFSLSFDHLQNQIYSLSDIVGHTARQLVEQINLTTSLQQKIDLLNRFLLRQLSLHNEDSIFDYCIEKIVATKGSITVKQLEKQTGYSSRWLNMKFIDKLGVSPKNLSSIIRFNQCYRQLILGSGKSLFKNDFYHLYYDQSHFIKDFKRFTGLSPAKLEKQINDFSTSYFET